jgi:uncharacterized membrane protein
MNSSTASKLKTYTLLLLLVLFCSAGNTVLSKGMKNIGALDLAHVSTTFTELTRVLSSGTIWLGILLMLLFMVCYMLALSRADYSFVMAFTAIAYALVPVLGYVFLAERVSKSRWTGIALIFLGVLLVNRTPLRTTGPGPDA